MKEAFKLVKQAGFKLTRPRRMVLEALSSDPLSVQEIAGILKKKRREIDLVTLYRVLELFVRLGLVHKTYFDDNTARYEIIAGKKHHHHIVCQKCGDIKDVPVNENKLIKGVENKLRFKVQKHILEFFGLCLKCQ